LSAPSTRRRSIGLFLRLLHDFQLLGGDRALVVENFRSFQLRLGQLFIGQCLAVIGESVRQVHALHPHQQLAFGDAIAKTRADLQYAAGRQGHDRHIPRYIGANHAGDIQLGRYRMRGYLRDRESFRMRYRDQVDARLALDPGHGRIFELGILRRRGPIASRQQRSRHNNQKR
jgi:hypothetical protein